MKLVNKVVKKYGNSGGVYLPADWVGGKVNIELVEQPPDPKKELLNSLPLENVVSLILYGSYVRKEITEGSDIDVILVTAKDIKINVPQEIRKRYDIQVRSVKSLRHALMHDPVFYKVIKDESMALINSTLLDEFRQIKPKMDGIHTRLDFMGSSIKIMKDMIAAHADSETLVYPVILRLKEILFMECFFANKKYTTGLLRRTILGRGITSRDFQMLMTIYRASRDGKKFPGHKISNYPIEELIKFLEEKMHHVKQKTLEKGN